MSRAGQGVFFIYDDAASQYVVVEPAAGTSVTYLPPGYEDVSIEGTKYLKLGGTYYRPYYEGGEAAVYRFPDRPPNRRNRTCLRADNPLRWPVPDTAGPRFPRYSSPQDRVLWPWHLRESLPGRVADRAR